MASSETQAKLDDLGLGSDSDSSSSSSSDSEGEEQIVQRRPATSSQSQSQPGDEGEGGGNSGGGGEERAPAPAAAAAAAGPVTVAALGLDSDSDEEEEEEEDHGGMLAGGASDLLAAARTRQEHRTAAAEPESFSVPTLPRPAPGTEVVHLSLNPGLVGVKLRETTPESVEVDYNSAVGAAAMGLKVPPAGAAIRWRFQRDASGNVLIDPATGKPHMETNARLVKWPDGSMQLLVGKQRYECQASAIAERFVLADQGALGGKRLLEPIAAIHHKMLLQRGEGPAAGGKGLKARSRAFQQAAEREKKGAIKRFETTMDPEKARLERIRLREEEERMERKRRRKAMGMGPRMDKAFLEDEEIDPTANVRSIKANVMAGGRRGRPRGGRYGAGDSDEDEDSDYMSDDSLDRPQGAQAQRRQLAQRRQQLRRGGGGGGQRGEEDSDEMEDDDEEESEGGGGGGGEESEEEEESDDEVVVKRRRGGGSGGGGGGGGDNDDDDDDEEEESE